MELLDMVNFVNSYFVFIINPIYIVVDPSDKLLAPRVQHSGPCLVSQILVKTSVGQVFDSFYNNEVWAIDFIFFQELAESD